MSMDEFERQLNELREIRILQQLDTVVTAEEAQARALERLKELVTAPHESQRLSCLFSTDVSESLREIEMCACASVAPEPQRATTLVRDPDSNISYRYTVLRDTDASTDAGAADTGLSQPTSLREVLSQQALKWAQKEDGEPCPLTTGTNLREGTHQDPAADNCNETKAKSRLFMRLA
ncbi:uncharacterized protein Tco025E_05635 [Trypanosoma conorhini]|uniref:Uncharacterized protein n=1 Tax=Trypanosoma conorhini TaxID=83891 RepID=A0A422PBW1_9TRYP|nr:uncharacterized protein Tco025E_05635 [Trypanosoma conorhini]RNF15186.1 hypothetical protein Tco025E_05635 [Trypanosoma conorhini]